MSIPPAFPPLFSRGFEELNERQEGIDIHQAIEAQQFKDLEFLIKKGADLKVENRFNDIPLLSAIKKYLILVIEHPNGSEVLDNSLKIVELLIKQQSLPNSDLSARNESIEKLLFIRFIKPNLRSLLKVLFDNGININAKDEDSNTLLHHVVCGMLHVNDARELLNRYTLYPLSYPKDSQFVEFFLENGADINARNSLGETPIDLAYKGFGGPKMAVFMDERFGRSSETGKHPLHVAIIKGNNELAKRLMNEQENLLDQPDSLKQTPLHLAVIEGNNEIATLLIEKNTGVNALDHTGRKPLHYALIQRNNEVAKLLIEKTDDLSALSEKGQTFLYLSAEEGLNEVTALLIDKRVNLDHLSGRDGMTAVCKAVCKQNFKIVKLLTEAGANLEIKDSDEKTPLDYASYFLNEGLEDGGIFSFLRWAKVVE